MALARKTVSGLFWAYGVFFGDKLLMLVSTAILARILTPEDFGVIAAALLFIGFFDAFRDFGIRDALIYTSEKVEDAAETAFCLTVGLGIVQCLAIVLLAPLVSHFVADPRAVEVLQVLSLVFVINGLAMTHEALLQKRLEFRRRYTIDLIAACLKAAVAIGLVLWGAGIWSIVAGHLTGATVRAIGRYVMLDWWPRFRFVADRARMLMRYGMHVFFVGVSGTLFDRIDQAIITVLLGERQLAFYFIALRIPEMILYQINSVLTNVLFSVFTTMKDQRTALVDAFHRTLKFSAMATVPAGCGIAAVAPELIPVVFGDQWFASVPLTQVLALAGVILCLPWSAGDVFKAIGRPDVTSKLQVIEMAYSLPIVVGLVWVYRDPLAACVGRLISMSIVSVVRLWIAARLLGFSPLAYLPLFRTSVIGGAAIVTAVGLWREAAADWSQSLILVTSIVVGAAAYGAVVWLFERNEIRFVVPHIRDAVRGDRPRPVAEEQVETV
jgi:PST family polysaccharide transporter